MIKAEVSIVGTVKRSASMRSNKSGEPYLSLVLSVKIPDGKGNNKDLDVLVSLPKAKESDVLLYTERCRGMAQGSLDIRKKEAEYSFYLSATKLSAKDVPEEDAIKGELTFHGRLKNENVSEIMNDKNGNPYLVFSAYSSEKVGEGFAYTWIRFIRFLSKEENIDAIHPDWLKPKARISAKGDFQVSAYSGNLRFTCIVRSMEEYAKENYHE